MMAEQTIRDPQDVLSMPKPDLSGVTADTLVLRIARNEAEVRAAQELRYKVFYEDLGAHPDQDMQSGGFDYDEYDPLCDHLLVVDTANNEEKIIGTYRMLLHPVADKNGVPMYTETEYDCTALRATGKLIMEVSRSCILDEYRGRSAINMLWQGIAAYVFYYDIGYLIGLPSFHGNSVDEYATELAYLGQKHGCDPAISPVVRKEGRDPVNDITVPFPDVDLSDMTERRLVAKLPPLVKGYLFLGGKFGQGVYIDQQYNTVDVCVVVDPSQVTARYFNHFARKDQQRQNALKANDD